ncbi:hypothetical protein FVE85_9456 [Porphyridium purpureum]|uniref:Uncharacterized protein n=1 Tax=Porphyridium purpureum TaxID=35688 RepID=A0A5J4YI76_PORPP|nr:hypothetical protein FVE85_9456 [Porphyridium purpureum]|eukprot:POR8280..scf261_15
MATLYEGEDAEKPQYVDRHYQERPEILEALAQSATLCRQPELPHARGADLGVVSKAASSSASSWDWTSFRRRLLCMVCPAQSSTGGSSAATLTPALRKAASLAAAAGQVRDELRTEYDEGRGGFGKRFQADTMWGPKGPGDQPLQQQNVRKRPAIWTEAGSGLLVGFTVAVAGIPGFEVGPGSADAVVRGGISTKLARRRRSSSIGPGLAPGPGRPALAGPPVGQSAPGHPVSADRSGGIPAGTSGR